MPPDIIFDHPDLYLLSLDKGINSHLRCEQPVDGITVKMNVMAGSGAL
jgi:hypothetical protein